MIPLYDDVPSERPPIVNTLLILLNVAAFALELSMGRHLPDMIRTWGMVPRSVVRAYVELPRLGFTRPLLTPLTAMFLHGGWLHILGNMWFLYLFGDNVEGRLGHGRYLAFYLLAGLIAGFAQIASDPGSLVPAIGASGAIAGTLGAYFVVFPYARVRTLVFLGIFITTWRIGAPWFLGIWFALQALSGLASFHLHHAGGVAWFEHVGGFLWGFVVGTFFRQPPPGRYGGRGSYARR